jgi:hypothetical protein
MEGSSADLLAQRVTGTLDTLGTLVHFRHFFLIDGEAYH